MKLIRHLVRFDLMSLSPVLGAWAGALLLQAAVLRIGPPMPITGQRPEMEISLDTAAIVMRFAVTAVLIAVLVQKHLLVGTTAFWRTRPLPRAAVLGSTLISGILLTVVVPCLWFMGVFLWMGLEVRAAAYGALAIAGEQAIVAGLALALASVSINLAQVVVVGVATMLLLTLGFQLAAGIPRQPALFTITVESAQWIGIMFWIVLGTAATLISVHQHLTLKTARSKGLIAAVVVSFLLLRPFPLWTVTAGPPGAEATPALQTPGVTLDLASIRVESYARTTDAGTEFGISHSALLDQSNPAGRIVLKPINAASVLTFPDGLSLRVSPGYVNARVEDDGETTLADNPYARLAETIDGAILAASSAASAPRYRFTFLEAREVLNATRAIQPGVLDVMLDLQAYRHAIAARVPLKVGSQTRSPRYAVEFTGTAALEDGIGVDIREAYVKDWFRIAPTYYVLCHQRLKQAVLAANRWERSFRSTVRDYSGLVVSATRLTFVPGPGAAAGLTLDREWLEDAELLVLKPEVLGRVSKSIRIDDYTLVPPPPPSPPQPAPGTQRTR